MVRGQNFSLFALVCLPTTPCLHPRQLRLLRSQNRRGLALVGAYLSLKSHPRAAPIRFNADHC